eukprot:69084-Chlamydomonas_euryale.AAC.1
MAADTGAGRPARHLPQSVPVARPAGYGARRPARHLPVGQPGGVWRGRCRCARAAHQACARGHATPGGGRGTR